MRLNRTDITTVRNGGFPRGNKGRESELVRAISTWPDFETFKLRDLLAALPSPMPKYMALRNAVHEAILVACRRQPEYAWDTYYHLGSRFLFGDFEAESIVSEKDIASATIKGFTTQLDTLNANEFFQLASALTTYLSSAEANNALRVGLDLFDDEIRTDDGDGPWSSELEPPNSLVVSLASYIWAGLGSPKVAERWQYAHVIRSVVELNWTKLLEALVVRAETGTATPFVDERLEFYVWHAYQWLLIGLARGGLLNPTGLRAAIPLLQHLVRKEHVIIRDFAAQALRRLIEAGVLKDSQISDLDSVNQPKLPEEVYTNSWASVEDIDITFEESLDDDKKYYFGIDIGPYWFKPLGRAFGLTEESINQYAHHLLRQQMGWHENADLWQDARQTLRIFDDRETFHSHGDLPKTDDLHAYHGHHTMMMVAAFLLKERPVRRYSDENTNKFNEWLSDYLLTRADRKWLSDRRDARLMRDLSPINGDSKYWRWSITAEYLDQQLLTNDGLTVFWGKWHRSWNDHHETVFVHSALVSRIDAEALVAALQTAPRLDQFYLPSAEDEHFETDTLNLKGWVKQEQLYARLDEGDPWAQGLHYPSPIPSEKVMEKLGLLALENERS